MITQPLEWSGSRQAEFSDSTLHPVVEVWKDMAEERADD